MAGGTHFYGYVGLANEGHVVGVYLEERCYVVLVGNWFYRVLQEFVFVLSSLQQTAVYCSGDRIREGIVFLLFFPLIP